MGTITCSRSSETVKDPSPIFLFPLRSTNAAAALKPSMPRPPPPGCSRARPWVKRSVGERGGERGGRAGPETTAPPWAAVARELDSWEWDSRRPRPDWDSVIFPCDILGNIESPTYRECHGEYHRIPVPRAHGSVPCLLVGSTRTPSSRTGKTCGKGGGADLLDPNYERGRTRNVWRLFLLILERQEAYL